MRRILGRRVASAVAVISIVVAAGPSVPGTVARAATVPSTAETVASRAGLARDIARDVAIAPDNGGYAVVDGFGGVHRAGSAPVATSNRAWRDWDHADGVAMVGGGYVVAG